MPGAITAADSLLQENIQSTFIIPWIEEEFKKTLITLFRQ